MSEKQLQIYPIKKQVQELLPISPSLKKDVGAVMWRRWVRTSEQQQRKAKGYGSPMLQKTWEIAVINSVSFQSAMYSEKENIRARQEWPVLRSNGQHCTLPKSCSRGEWMTPAPELQRNMLLWKATTTALKECISGLEVKISSHCRSQNQVSYYFFNVLLLHWNLLFLVSAHWSFKFEDEHIHLLVRQMWI